MNKFFMNDDQLWKLLAKGFVKWKITKLEIFHLNGNCTASGVPGWEHPALPRSVGDPPGTKSPLVQEVPNGHQSNRRHRYCDLWMYSAEKKWILAKAKHNAATTPGKLHLCCCRTFGCFFEHVKNDWKWRSGTKIRDALTQVSYKLLLNHTCNPSSALLGQRHTITQYHKLQNWLNLF